MIGVIDTSALIRFFIPDGPMPDGFEVFLTGVGTGHNIAIAPELIIAEVANVIFKKCATDELTNDEGELLLKDMLETPIRFFGHMELIYGAYDLSRKFNLTVYDGLFLSLALEKGAVVFSADKKILKASKTLGINV